MTRTAWLMAIAVSTGVHAQQGFLPLGRLVDGPATEQMHRLGNPGHSAIRPYLREDLVPLEEADTRVPFTWMSKLEQLADPTSRLHGGLLLDALAGASFGENEWLKDRFGLGGWIGWNVSPRWTITADLQGWSERFPNYLDSTTKATMATPGEGLARGDGPTVLHYDWNASVDYKAGDHFHFTLGKGRNFIGEGNRSLFLSDEAYGYPYLKIVTTAWHIRYVNLFTMMDDIRGAGGDPARFGKKFASMHYLDWNLSRRVNIGIFESIIWQDNDPDYPRGFDLAYLNPVIFYRPVEFGLGSADNAILGFALNVKVGRKTLLYSQLALDEFFLDHVRSNDGWYGNKQAYQLGVITHDAFGVDGLMLRLECDHVRPFTYSHYDTRQNYSHHGQPLAHPYGSGFVEGLIQGEWRKGHWVVGNVVSFAWMGQDTLDAVNGNYGNNIFLSERDRPLDAGGRPQDLGYSIGLPSPKVVFQNELRAGWLLGKRTGLMLELAYTFRLERSELEDPWNTHYVRAGISTNLHERHPFQVVRYHLN